MTIRNFIAYSSFLILSLQFQPAKSQTKMALFEGIFVTGYVDHGAFINCAGPSVKMNKKSYSLLVGLLPSLRIKSDNAKAGATRNTALMPGLGFGITSVFRHIAFQIPFYYNPKTSVENGKWNLGAGLGYKF